MTIVLRGPTHLQVASPRLDKRLPREQSRIENGDRDAYLCLYHAVADLCRSTQGAADGSRSTSEAPRVRRNR